MIYLDKHAFQMSKDLCAFMGYVQSYYLMAWQSTTICADGKTWTIYSHQRSNQLAGSHDFGMCRMLTQIKGVPNRTPLMPISNEVNDALTSMYLLIDLTRC